MREGRLGYNSSNDRYGLLSSDLWIDTGFHCGECLEVLIQKFLNKWTIFLFCSILFSSNQKEH